ncbi:MAG: DUF1080 domain-containing protein [Planctomycetes bacterium]|nr:DUF1080 domain-containing protein [Planctomycetota bacterium]
MCNSDGVKHPSRRQSSWKHFAGRLNFNTRRGETKSSGTNSTFSRCWRPLSGALGCCIIVCSGFVFAAGVPDKTIRLFDSESFPKKWVFHSAERKSKLEETWKVRKAEKVEDSVLICTGKPLGYIRTVAPYSNYEYRMQWKYPKDANGNSGVLIHASQDKKDDRIWPRSIQVQLHQPVAGSIFPVGGALTDNKFDSKDLKLPVDTWHDCLIVCKDGTVTVSINGKKLGTVTGCLPNTGCIALQSEGSEVHFRRITLKPLK